MLRVGETRALVARRCFDCRNEVRRNRKVFEFWIKFDRWQDRVQDEQKEYKKKLILRKWIPSNSSWLPPMFITPEKEEDVIPPKPLDEQTRVERGNFDYDWLSRQHMLKYLDLSPSHMRRFKRYQMLLAMQYDQRFIAERQLVLGPDLAAAHFIVQRGGAVKFLGDDDWHRKDDEDNYILPAQNSEGFLVEAIDASNTKLMYEGFGNMIRLSKLRYLNVANCEYMTDWCLNRIHQYENTLEFLDLSNCKRLSAKGLSSLSVLKQLKYLRLDGLEHVKDIAKVALLLEEHLPNLIISGVNYDKALAETKKLDKLLSHPNVRQDARGNIFLKDSIGDFYYLKGSVPERPVVDEENLPLMMTKVRKDAPVVPFEVSEEVNELSDGKLKHLLAGSPSSGEWTQATERILKFEVQWKLRNGEFVHPLLYPDSMKEEARAVATVREELEEKLLNAEPTRLLKEPAV